MEKPDIVCSFEEFNVHRELVKQVPSRMAKVTGTEFWSQEHNKIQIYGQGRLPRTGVDEGKTRGWFVRAPESWWRHILAGLGHKGAFMGAHNHRVQGRAGSGMAGSRGLNHALGRCLLGLVPRQVCVTSTASQDEAESQEAPRVSLLSLVRPFLP